MVKKVLSTIIDVISVIIIVASIVLLLSVLLTKSGKSPSFMGYSVFRVLTGSMEPEIQTGSMIIVKRTDPSLIKEGDVISFYSRDPKLGGAVNTHRVFAVSGNEFITKGDSNMIEDDYPVKREDIIGLVVFTSYVLGRIIRFVSNPLIFMCLIIVPLVILFIISIVRFVKMTGVLARQEEEAAVKAALEDLRKKKALGESENINDELANSDKSD